MRKSGFYWVRRLDGNTLAAPEVAAAARWSGRWTSGNVAEHTGRLRRVIDTAGWEVTGDARWARFDPPWKPPFLRRNEIVIPVRVEG